MYIFQLFHIWLFDLLYNLISFYEKLLHIFLNPK